MNENTGARGIWWLDRREIDQRSLAGWKVGKFEGWENYEETGLDLGGRRVGGDGIRCTRERIAWGWRAAKCFAGNGEN